ncbi:BPSS1780 family membrane protein [Ottowia sp.]|uniref:BPSS1780 family membrane protein n=1 Tax=Ottowia sp. TaxID=1898956 RepID=UPI003A872121
MKLRIVPARTGLQWVREGLRVLMRAPLALSGLFFMVIAATVVLAVIPVVGTALALLVVPAATVALMSASEQASQGRFPMPKTLLVAFQQSARQTRAMLVLGAIYAGAVVLIALFSMAMDDGQLTQLLTKYEGRITPELMADPALQPAARAALQRMVWSTLLYVPVSVLLWHAPALVHWHGVSVGKSLFFSAVAVLRNASAFLMYGIGWVGLTFAGWLLLMSLAGLFGNLGLALNGMLPLALLIGTAFYASLWFTFKDSFEGAGYGPSSFKGLAGL